ncbi:hypothetical protein AAE02nite_17730 [Adhaeribacter aerolatus]|uniref:Peptidase M14 domain-containing protein n=1 Tax=Adhaeribacter aerolatus TaxID=670289 RepID=A0A512AWL0_9BACT|nr:M14 family metallopeptidase [Adhaeribacter aerolatus]GEO04109.1 hypothetical protein AAE02nite_17730 [Adhaeribacter aerolatus]
MLLHYLLLLTTPWFLPPDWLTPHEKSGGQETATYQECISYYEQLDQAYEEVKLFTYGLTDSGRPLHLVVISLDRDFEVQSLRQRNKRLVLVQNGIHPGEPEGIDASMMLARDYMQQKDLRASLQNVVLLIIPVYNVDGALNRNRTSRANQNGPASYGFRGNARNLDLNRDYIKTDSRNARTFTQIFQEWQPDIFVDTHTSNGADYQHVMTLIATQKDKLASPLKNYLTQNLLPALEDGMEKAKFPMAPYVNTKGATPETGLLGFMDSPRYSSGYTALFNTIGFVTETHMLKPFDQRVKATYAFLELMVKMVNQDAARIADARSQANQAVLTQTNFPLNWVLDTTQADKVKFRGYRGKYKPSEVSGLPRLYYDRKAAFTKNIPYYNTFRATTVITKPKAYVVPQAWGEVIARLQLNNVTMEQLPVDTELEVELYHITDYQTAQRPYEGHYLHRDVQVRPEKRKLLFYRGDYLIYLNQPANRYLVETLEPQAVDSFFNWGFFDAILEQKEYFSDYVFEDVAAELLKNNPPLRQQHDAWKKANPEQAKSAQSNLDFIYRHSPYYEPSHLRYPIARIL